MGIIKLKNVNEEQQENAQPEGVQVFEAEVEIPVSEEKPLKEQEQWDDPAVLHEDEARTDENSRHYILNNGTAKSVYSAEPTSFFDEAEKKWKQIDNSLEDKGDAFENKNGKFKTRISKAEQCKKVTITQSDKQLSWEYLGKQEPAMMAADMEEVPETVLKIHNDEQTEVKSVNSSAVYENIEKDTDLEYRLFGGNLKENIIVREKSADYKYLFALNTKGLKLRLSEDNESLELYTEKIKEDGTVEEKVEFTIPSPYMYDANGVSSDDVYYELDESEDGKFSFAVVASEEWINAEDRAFPVTIDPQIITDNNSVISKQVQYRIVSTGSGSGSSAGHWTNTSSADIRVYKSDYIEYRTCLSVKRSLMNLPNNRISSVKLILTPSTTFNGSLIVNNCYCYYKSNEGKLEQDITNIFKNNVSDFTINIEPYSYGYIDGYFSMTANPPVIEIEYLTNENTKATKKSFLLSGFANGNINLATGDMTTSFCDVESDHSVGGMEIYHVYKKSSEDYFLGDNFRLNIHETLIKNGSSGLDANYIYTDAQGDKHGFKDFYYYIDISGKKTYISKSGISVEADGTLKYNGYIVYGEYRSASGLKALTQLEGFKYVSYLEQRSDELKQADEKVESYGNALKEFVAVNKNDGSITYRLRSYLGSASGFDDFIAYVNSSTRILLTENEALAYKSLILQKEALEYQSKTLDQQKTGLGYSQNSMRQQIDTMNNTKLSEEAYINKATQEGINVSVKSTLQQQIFLADDQKNTTLNIKSNNLKQITAINNQITMYIDKKTQYLSQMKAYLTVYYTALDEQKKLKRQLPVNFLTDGKIFKGFNEFGQLVAVYDMYNNSIIIEYESYFLNYSSGYRIARIYDNNNNAVTFAYSATNKLSCVTDAHGKKVFYEYSGSKLTAIKYDTGEKLVLSYQNGNISSVVEEKKKLQTNITYTGNKPTNIYNYSLINKVCKGASNNTTVLLETISLSFVQKASLMMNYVTITNDKTRERYYFDGNNNLSEYRLENDGFVTNAEQYEYVSYWNGTTAQSNPRSVIRKAAKSSLYAKSLDAYSFVSGETETTTLDQFENALKTTTSEIKLNATGSNKQSTVIDYEYDDNHKLVQEKTTVTYTNPAKTVVLYKKYNYNANGDVIRTESFVDGEEYTTGKTIEETVYDDKGNIIKSFTYNALDAASKFYTETKYDENGKVIAEVDETGENNTKFRYVDGTNLVCEETLPNGSKLAYGHDYDDTVTAITQSTEEGEENSTQKIYRHGEVVELSSGNNTVKYEYDGKRRTTKVFLNDDKNAYCENSYTDTTLNGVAVEKCESKNANKTITVSYTDKLGNLRRIEQSDGKVLQYEYEHGKIKVVKNASGSTIESVAYDELDRQTSHTFNGNVHTTEYNDYGQTAKETVKFGGSIEDKLEYAYSYKENAARTLAGLTIGAFGENYEQDKNGRSVKIMQTLGGQTYTKRFGYYKQGDHATSRVNTIYYSKNGISDGKVTYTYDGMGNIISVNENGKQRYKYAYDKIGRLVSEKDLDGNREICYTYDNSGNILTKIDNGTITDYRYKDGTDRLMSFGTELFAYDDMGNPTTYRNMSCVWEKGRQLKSISDGANTVSFTYDEFGMRTTKTAGGITTNYVYENGKLLREVTGSEKIDFVYGSDGIIGFRTGNKNYLYRKNVFGDVTEIYSDNGTLVGKYSYTAFGECIVKVNEGGIAEKNPIRYRGYYYDEETGLYYLKSRYYDPVTGRFITIDDISYIDPETINGLNLYAYCGNNPVMRIDENGNAWWHWIVGVLIVVASVALSVVTAGIAAPITAALGSGLLGAIVGGAVAGAIGGAITAFGISVATQGIKTGFTNIDWKQVGIQTAIGALSGAVLGGIGGGIKYARAAHYLKSNGIATDPKEILRNFKGIPSVKTSNGTIGFRYFDNINAMSKGKWLTSALTNNPIRDLVLYNNNATMVSKFMIEKGAQYLVGTIAKSPVNAIQYFVANVNWLSLL